MLSSQNRLKKKKDFEKVFKKGKGFKEGFLILKLVKNNLKETRFGFVVGLKTAKKASLRNQIKRSLKRIIKERLPQTTEGFDVVLIVGPGWNKKNFLVMPVILNKLFKKAEI